MPTTNENTTTALGRDVLSKWLDTMKDDASADHQACLDSISAMVARSEKRAETVSKYSCGLALEDTGEASRMTVLRKKCEDLALLYRNVETLLAANAIENVDEGWEEDRKLAVLALQGGLKKAIEAGAGGESTGKVVVGLEKGVKRATRDVPISGKWFIGDKQ